MGVSSHDLASLEEAIRGEWRHKQSAKGPALALNDAYAILNVAARAADAEVKRAYRRLMNQHHPDKLVSKGLPEEMMKIAENKTHEIRQAYERIKEERGF